MPQLATFIIISFNVRNDGDQVVALSCRGAVCGTKLHKSRGYLGKDDAVLLQEVGAALAQGGLAAEVGDDRDQPVTQPLDHHALRDARHQAQRVDVAADVVQEGACDMAHHKAWALLERWAIALAAD